MRAPALELKTCPVCGIRFKPEKLIQKYCGRECYANSRKKNYEPQEPETKTGKPLEQWVSEARECNLDYGTYRALIESGRTYSELKATAANRNMPTHSHLRKGYKIP